MIKLKKKTKMKIALGGIVLGAIAIGVLITGYWGNYHKVISINSTKNKLVLESEDSKTYTIAKNGESSVKKFSKDLNGKIVNVDFNTFETDMRSGYVSVKKSIIGNIRYKYEYGETKEDNSLGNSSNVYIEYEDGKVKIVSVNAKKLVDRFYLNTSTGDFSLDKKDGLSEVKIDDKETVIKLKEGDKASVVTGAIGSHLSELFNYIEFEKVE